MLTQMQNFWNVYSILTTSMDVSLRALANLDYRIPFVVTI